MRKSGRSPLAPLAAACAGTLLFAGCLPIPNTVTLSPPVLGTVRGADGTAVAGAPLALSTAYYDSACATPALRTTTDAAGRFEFPATRQREQWTVILFDRQLCYNVCGGPATTDPLFRGCYMHSVPEATDSLSCVGSDAAGSGGGRIACVASDPRRRREPAVDQ